MCARGLAEEGRSGYNKVSDHANGRGNRQNTGGRRPFCGAAGRVRIENMDYLGISYDYRNKPSLEPAFIPFAVWEKAYLAGAERPFKVGRR